MNRSLAFAIGGGVLAVVSLGCGSGGSNNGGGTQVDNGSPYAVASSAAALPKATGPFVAFKDGTYEIGTSVGQVKSGTYKTTVPADSSGCYWERLKALDGSFESIIANGNLNPGSPGILTIKASDKGVRVNGGCEWKRSS